MEHSEIKIAIADDHQLFLYGIKTFLEQFSEFSIIIEANDGYELIDQLEQFEVDIILMDINMPNLDGLDATKIVSKKYPQTKIIALTQYSEARFIKAMVKRGAVGYILKNCSTNELSTAITKVFAGDKYFSQEISLNLIDNLQKKKGHSNSLFPGLSAREKEIISLLCQEYSSHEISDLLFLSFHTVEVHRKNIMMKVGAKNIAGIVRWAVENDLHL